MQTVRFTQMADGTREDYELLNTYFEEHDRTLTDRVLAALRALDGSWVTRLEHCLQSATRAHRDGRDEEYDLAPFTHAEMAAAVLRPFVPEEYWWIVKHHGVFQLCYSAHHLGQDRNVRDRFRDSAYFDACVEFCDRYDQSSFDPGYDSLPFEFFEPMVRRVFAEPRYLVGDIA